jgi:HEPN domain-containing protein
MKFAHEPPENAHLMFALAKSDLSVARVGKITDDTRYETLCTLCQQAIEKSLKSLMIYHGIPYPLDHSIEYLIVEMEKQRIVLPADIKISAIAHVTIEGGFSEPLKSPFNFGTAIPLSEYAKDRRFFALPIVTVSLRPFMNIISGNYGGSPPPEIFL